MSPAVEAKLSKRQQDVLNFIRQFMQEMNCPPTVREIARHFGFSSPRTVQVHLEGLSKKNALQFRTLKARGHRLARGLTLAQGLTGFPVLGRVPAGVPNWQSDDVEGSVDIKTMFPVRDGRYALKVKGDSMADAGILEGDTVLVQCQATAQAGDIVVALVDGEATVKRWARRDGHTFLMPANAKYKPIPVTPAVQVSGKVIGVLRSYK